ncbi:MAG: DUF928 domain-containing protein [Cyanobacteria bacterium J06635_11]
MTQRLCLKGISILTLAGMLGLSQPLAWGWPLATPAIAAETPKSNDELRQGLPGRRLGGGTRTPSMAAYNDQLPLTALIPENVLSITTAAYPRLLFHLPVIETSQTVELVLYNSAEALVYQQQFDVIGNSGIVSIDLSNADGLAPLTVDETYQWYFTIVADDRAQDISVDGWVKRVDIETWSQQHNAPHLSAQLTTPPPLEQARLLHEEADLWSEAAQVVHSLRQQNPQSKEVTAVWEQLLEEVGLSELQSAPLAELVVKPI